METSPSLASYDANGGPFGARESLTTQTGARPERAKRRVSPAPRLVPPRSGGRPKGAADFSPPREGGARSERAKRAEKGGEP